MRTYLISAVVGAVLTLLLTLLLVMRSPEPPKQPVQQSYHQQVALTPTVIRTVPIASFEGRWDPVREPEVSQPEVLPEQEEKVVVLRKPKVEPVHHTDICARHRMVKRWFGKRWRCVKK